MDTYEKLGARIRRQIETHTIEEPSSPPVYMFASDSDADMDAEPSLDPVFTDPFDVAEAVQEGAHFRDLSDLTSKDPSASLAAVDPSTTPPAAAAPSAAVEAAAPQGAD